MSSSGVQIARGRIARAFEAARAQERAALVLYIMAGDPDLAATAEIVRLFDGLGVDLVELGLPFSDPVADGPVIQQAGLRALRHEITVRRVLECVARLREEVALPIVAMGYTNPIMALGYETFAKQAAASGLDGVIVADLPPEEGADLLALCERHGLDWIQLAAPTTPPERLGYLSRVSRGFLYYVSRTGITGARAELSETLVDELAAVRAASCLPVAVGFGISTPEQAALVGTHADGVVIGSAVVRIVGEAPDRAECLARLRAFVEPVRDALRRRTGARAAGRAS